MLINMKMPAIVGIFIFISRENFRLFDPDCLYKFTYLMTNSADPDQPI